MRRRSAFDFTLLALIATLAFFSTLPSRPLGYAALPSLTDGAWRSLSAHAVVMARNWYEEGLFRVRLSLHLMPLSIETVGKPEDTVRESSYFSYPPTFLFPVHAFQLAAGRPVTLGDLGRFSCAAHFFTVLFLTFLAYALALPSGGHLAILAGAGTATLSAWCVPALQFFGACYWPDTVVQPLLALFYFFLVVLLQNPGKKTRRGLLGATVFVGCLTEWSFYLHLICVVPLLAWTTGWRFSARALIVPALVALGLEALYLMVYGNHEAFLFTLNQRVGSGQETLPFLEILHRQSSVAPFPGSLLYFTLPIVALGAAALSFVLDRREGRKPHPITIVLAGSTIGPVLHFLLLRQHYQDHAYEWVKLVIPQGLALLLLVRLLPFRIAHALMLGLLLVIFVPLTKNHLPRVLLWWNDAGETVEKLARFVDEHTDRTDFLLTTGYEMDPPEAPPIELQDETYRFGYSTTISHKRGFLINDFAQVGPTLKTIFVSRFSQLEKAGIKLLVSPEHLAKWKASLQRYPFVEHEGYRLYTLPLKDFIPI